MPKDTDAAAKKIIFIMKNSGGDLYLTTNDYRDLIDAPNMPDGNLEASITYPGGLEDILYDHGIGCRFGKGGVTFFHK